MNAYAPESLSDTPETDGIEQVARVVALAEDGRAWIEPVGASCGRCHEAGGCGKTHVTRMFGSPRRFLVQNPAGAKVGDEVLMLLPAGSLYRQGTLAYLCPLAGLLVGALAGKFLAGEAGALAGGLFAFVAVFWLVPKIWGRMLANPAFAPKIAKTIAHSSGGSSCD